MQAGPARESLIRLLLWAAPLTWLGCGGGGGTDIVLPSLIITTSTDGVELDPDGYGLAVDGNSPQAIGLDATATVDRLPDGLHTVELSGVAANCAAANNPRSVTVSAGGTTTAAFAITCGPTAGSIAVTTSTSGAGSDPDGFALTVDGVDGGAIGLNAIVTLAGLTPGVHPVGLTGLAANCVVGGDNPRSVTVTPGQTTPVGFTVSCAAPPPGSGSVQITTATTGTSVDADGYTVSLDGGTPQSIVTNGTLTIGSVPPGSHSVQLSGEAANCTVSGNNPRAVTIGSGQVATVQFAIACVTPPPGTGSVEITAVTSGNSLDPDGYTIRVDQSSPQTLTINGTRTIGNLVAGPHTVQLGGLATNCTVAGDNPRPVTVTAGQRAPVAFAITCVATGSSVNLRIAGLYLTQSTQTLAGGVPLVADRRAYLRVFAVADRANTLRPNVRVRFFRSGAVIRTLTINAGGGSTPSAAQEGTLTSSWNQSIDASLIEGGTSVLAEIDPSNAIEESNETDNSFPVSGTPQSLTVQAVPPARIRFIPIQQPGQSGPGNVTAANKDQLLDLARKLYPLNGIETDLHQTFMTDSALGPNGEQWNQVLSDIDGLRVIEGSDRTYYGVASLSYTSGIVGIGFVGLPTAMGTDNPGDVKRVLAHELGHTWDQLHTPCAHPPNVDPNYPYDAGIGVYGFDVAALSLKPPSTSDIMGYCSDPWISDYIYQRVMSYRQASPALSRITAGSRQRTILVWGRIVNGRPVLEPAFQVVTRPSLPARPGAYSVEGTAADGSSLFSLSFDVAEVADDPGGGRHFAFAVPVDQGRAARLADLRLSGPGGMASAASLSVARLRAGVAPDSIVARREARGVALEWNASANPMIMVRDPDTGEVLSFARGGKGRVLTTKGSLDLIVSDGVQSEAKRVTVSR
jgi:hypothetical protein